MGPGTLAGFAAVVAAVLAATSAASPGEAVPGRMARTLEALGDSGAGEGDPVGFLAARLDDLRLPAGVAGAGGVPDNPGNRLQADLAMDGVFVLQGVQGRAARPDGSIDWEHRGPRDDPEWAWFLNRHGFLRHLETAYLATGDPAYARATDRLLLDWIQANPPPGFISFSSSWRALEAARRILDSWIPVFRTLRDDPLLSPATRAWIVVSLHEHGSYLRHNHHFGGNHQITEMLALATIALACPFFGESGEWLAYADSRIAALLDDLVYPDGSYAELANHYQKIAGDSFQAYLDLLRAFDRAGAVPGLEERVAAMWTFYLQTARPDGFGPLNNDSDLENNYGDIWRLLRAGYPRSDWSYVASGGRRGIRPPGPATRYFPWAGILVSRDDWTRASGWSFFDLGPHGTDHQQDDRLHFSLFADGLPWLVDSGRYVYRDDRWSAYFRSAPAHNVVTIEGLRRVLPDNRTDVPIDGARVDAEGSVAAGSVVFRSASGGETATHTRVVIHRNPGVWLVIDRLFSFRARTARFHWNFHPRVGEVRVDGNEFHLRGPDGVPPLRMSRLPGDGAIRWRFLRGEEAPVIAGWYSPEYNQREASVAAVGELSFQGEAFQAWLFASSAAGPVSARIDPGDPDGLAVILRRGGTEERVELRFDGRVPASGDWDVVGGVAVRFPGDGTLRKEN